MILIKKLKQFSSTWLHLLETSSSVVCKHCQSCWTWLHHHWSCLGDVSSPVQYISVSLSSCWHLLVDQESGSAPSTCSSLSSSVVCSDAVILISQLCSLNHFSTIHHQVIFCTTFSVKVKMQHWYHHSIHLVIIWSTASPRLVWDVSSSIPQDTNNSASLWHSSSQPSQRQHQPAAWQHLFLSDSVEQTSQTCQQSEDLMMLVHIPGRICHDLACWWWTCVCLHHELLQHQSCL